MSVAIDSGLNTAPTSGFQQTELGPVPHDWRVCDATDVLDSVASGRSHAGSRTSEFPLHGSTGVIGRCASADYSGKSVLVARVGANAGTITIVDGRYGVTDNTLILKVSEKVDFNFFRYQIEQKNLNRLVFGSGQPLITGTQIKELKFALPSKKSEQKAIAEALSDADALIESLESLIAKKRAIKQGAMQELLSGHRRLAGFSDKWNNQALGDLFSFKNGLNKAKRFFGAGTPIVNFMDVLTSPHVQARRINGQVTLTPAERDNFSAKKGDVFFTRTSETVEEIGMASVLTDDIPGAVFSGFILRARPIRNVFDNVFVGYALRSEQVRSQIIATASYTTRALTNGRLLSRVTLVVPPRNEQKAIGGALSDMDAEINELEAKLSKARQIKQGMMQELLTGRVRLL